jgi:hypothetical protein
LKPRSSPFAPWVVTSFSAASTFSASSEPARVSAATSTCVKSYAYIASSGGWKTGCPLEVLTPTLSTPYAASYCDSKLWNGPVPTSAVSRPPAKVRPSTQLG